MSDPKRAMRVFLECGHIRLMRWNLTVAGIGASTKCPVCPEHTVRLVVKMEETGVTYTPSMNIWETR